MESISKKKIAPIIIIAYILVIGLLFLTFGSLSKKDSVANIGILKSDAEVSADTQPERQTEQERIEEYESREEMPQVTEESFHTTVNRFLSAGNFSELDKTLRYWQETYKDSTDESESKTVMIERYRGDIAYYMGIAGSGETLPVWQFKTADTLAACIAYTPIMQKYNAFIDQDSVLFPAMTEGAAILLSKSEKTCEELIETKQEINRTRTEENAIQQIEVYDLILHGYPCQFIAVMDRNTMTWMPYSLKVTNNMVDLPTVSLGREILRNSPNCNLDISIAIPAMLSERPDGMDGNIDRIQDGIPNSEDLPPVDIVAPAISDATQTESAGELSGVWNPTAGEPSSSKP